jgi:hypothetical protein
MNDQLLTNAIQHASSCSGPLSPPPSPPPKLSALSPPPSHYKRRSPDAIIRDVHLPSRPPSPPPPPPAQEELERRPPIQYPLPPTPPRSPGQSQTSLVVKPGPVTASTFSRRQTHGFYAQLSSNDVAASASDSTSGAPFPTSSRTTPPYQTPQHSREALDASTLRTRKGSAAATQAATSGKTNSPSSFRRFDFFKRSGSGS